VAAEASLLGYRPALVSPLRIIFDRVCDADWIGELAIKKGAWADIPPKSNRNGPIRFRPYLDRARNLVERFFNKIKHFRAVATRFDKHDANYLASVKLAAAKIWMRFMSR
jgi:transposase